jgi:hypothetical protein
MKTRISEFRIALAQEVANQIGADVLTEKCPDCPFPLLMKKDQSLPGCWFCVTDRLTAQRGRTALTKAKMAARGIWIVDFHAHPND